MQPAQRKWLQLLLAVAIAASAAVLYWFADSAAQEQYLVFRNAGCWPETVEMSGQVVATPIFWRNHVRDLGLGGLDRFFHMRVDHRIHLYLITFASLIGWTVLILRRIARGDGTSSGGAAATNWDTYIASLVLAAIAGAVVFGILISSRAALDNELCVSKRYRYMADLAGLAAGLSVTAFFDWFEAGAKKLWGMIAGS